MSLGLKRPKLQKDARERMFMVKIGATSHSLLCQSLDDSAVSINNPQSWKQAILFCALHILNTNNPAINSAVQIQPSLIFFHSLFSSLPKYLPFSLLRFTTTNSMLEKKVVKYSVKRTGSESGRQALQVSSCTLEQITRLGSSFLIRKMGTIITRITQDCVST